MSNILNTLGRPTGIIFYQISTFELLSHITKTLFLKIILQATEYRVNLI